MHAVFVLEMGRRCCYNIQPKLKVWPLSPSRMPNFSQMLSA